MTAVAPSIETEDAKASSAAESLVVMILWVQTNGSRTSG